MAVTKQQLKEALSAIWALVYRASQVGYLDHEGTPKLQEALHVLSAGREGDEYFNRWASHVHDCVRISGLLSIPARKPTSTEEIMADCERLQRHLDRDTSE